VYLVVLAEMMDIDDGHISLASPLGRALGGRRIGEEVSLRLPTAHRRLRITGLITVHQSESKPKPAGGRKAAKGNGKR
jgi:transcription elongation factor GreA